MPLSRQNGTLTVALADPFNVTAVDTLQQVTGLHIDLVTAPERDILNCLELYYSTGDTIGESIDKVLEEKDRQGAQPLEEVLSRMANKDEDAPVIRLVRQIITRAVNNRASDVHFEPEERMMRVRTRVDGVLFQDVLIPKAMQSAVTTRMKILADLDLAETNIPQDGRASVVVGGRQVNLRVSSLPDQLRRERGRAHSRSERAIRQPALPRVRPRRARPVPRSDQPALRRHPGHRADRQRQDHDPLRGAARGQHHGSTAPSPWRTRSNTACRWCARPRSRKRSG